jgi:hypothetical protein
LISDKPQLAVSPSQEGLTASVAAARGAAEVCR